MCTCGTICHMCCPKLNHPLLKIHWPSKLSNFQLLYRVSVGTLTPRRFLEPVTFGKTPSSSTGSLEHHQSKDCRMGVRVISKLGCPRWLTVPEQLQSKINIKMEKGKEERLLKVTEFRCFDFLCAQFNLPERSLIFRDWLVLKILTFDLLESKEIAKWVGFFFPHQDYGS